jgi:hypothetical protein
MLETFKVRLKAKSTAAGANLSKERIDAIADRLNQKFPDLKEEADHDKEIDERYDEVLFKDLAAIDDHARAKAAKDKKDKDAKEKKEEKSDPAEAKEDPNEPAWAKALREQNEKLSQKLEAIEKKDQQQTLAQKLATNPKLKDIPEVFWKKRKLPETAEEIEAFADEAVTDYALIAPAEGALKPAAGGEKKGNNKAATKEELDAIFPK